MLIHGRGYSIQSLPGRPPAGAEAFEAGEGVSNAYSWEGLQYTITPCRPPAGAEAFEAGEGVSNAYSWEGLQYTITPGQTSSWSRSL